MSALLDTLEAAGNRPMLARSLFLWHRMLGPASDAGRRLKRMSGQIVALPVGADIAAQSVSIAAVPDGFDVQPGALPGADAVFAFVGTDGLRLEMTGMPATTGGQDWPGRQLRRLRVLDAHGAPFQRRGGERVLLRYRLDPAILQAPDIVLLLFTREPGGASARLGPLHPWIEIEQDGQRRFVQPEESRAVGLGGDDFVRLCAFAPLGPGQPPTDAAPTVSLYLELTGETIDASLIGETLLV